MAVYGIGFTWTIGDSGQSVEVTRSADDGAGSPSTATEESLATLEPGTTQYIDILPNDNTLRHYRVRHVAPGFTPGTFSSYVRAKPRVIPGYSGQHAFQDTL